MTSADLSPITDLLLQGAGAIVLGLAGWATQRLIAWLNLKVSAQQTAALDGALQKALTYGIQQAKTTIDAKGWDHVDVKNQVLGTALDTMVQKFPDALKGIGVDLADPKVGPIVTAMLDRAFPAAATVAVASPVTPPGPAATAADPLGVKA